MKFPRDIVNEFLQGLNCTEGEAARSGYISRSLTPHAIVHFNILSEEGMNKQQLLQLLQTTRHLNHNSFVSLISPLEVNDSNFKANCKITADSNDVAHGTIEGKFSNEGSAIQEVNMRLDFDGIQKTISN